MAKSLESRMTETPEAAEKTEASEEGARRKSSIQWNKDEMATSFANVVNIQGTREQVELFFGINRSWKSINCLSRGDC